MIPRTISGGYTLADLLSGVEMAREARCEISSTYVLLHNAQDFLTLSRAHVSRARWWWQNREIYIWRGRTRTCQVSWASDGIRMLSFLTDAEIEELREIVAPTPEELAENAADRAREERRDADAGGAM